MSTSTEHLAALLSKMNDGELTATFDRALGQFEIVFTDDRGRSRPFTMPIDPDDLWNQIQLRESDRDALWPEASVEEASLRLFNVHLIEAIMTAQEGHNILRKNQGGIRAVSSNH